MPCLPLPSVEIPEPPIGLSFALPDLPTEFDPNLCCKIPPVKSPVDEPPLPPIPGALLNAAVLSAIDKAQAQIDSYLDKLPLECPKE